jgi:hypothetical protein
MRCRRHTSSSSSAGTQTETLPLRDPSDRADVKGRNPPAIAAVHSPNDVGVRGCDGRDGSDRVVVQTDDLLPVARVHVQAALHVARGPVRRRTLVLGPLRLEDRDVAAGLVVVPDDVVRCDRVGQLAELVRIDVVDCRAPSAQCRTLEQEFTPHSVVI